MILYLKKRESVIDSNHDNSELILNCEKETDPFENRKFTRSYSSHGRYLNRPPYAWRHCIESCFLWFSLAGRPHSIYTRTSSFAFSEKPTSSRKMAVNSADQDIEDLILECDSELEDSCEDTDTTCLVRSIFKTSCLLKFGTFCRFASIYYTKDGYGYIAAPELPGQPLLGHASLFRGSKQRWDDTESLYVRVATSDPQAGSKKAFKFILFKRYMLLHRMNRIFTYKYDFLVPK